MPMTLIVGAVGDASAPSTSMLLPASISPNSTVMLSVLAAFQANAP